MPNLSVRVLLVGSDESDFVLLRDLLGNPASGSYDVYWASDHAKAVDYLAQGLCDICVLDSQQAEGNGLQLLSAMTIRRCKVPVLYLSEEADHEVDVKVMRAGAADYLVKKELNGPLLERSIQHALARQRATEALRKSEGKYRELVEKASSIIMRLDSDGRIAFINEFTEAFFGYHSYEILGRSVLGTLIPPVDSEGREMAPLLREVLVHPESHTRLETEVLLRDGDRAWVVWTNRTILTPEGKPDGVLAVGTDVTDQRRAGISDITERRALQKQLLHREKLASLGLLVSGITHEINNPNTFISFNLPILRDYLSALMPIFDEYASQHPDLRFFYMPYPRFRADLFKLLDNMEHGTSRISGIVSSLKNFLRKRDGSELQRTDISSLIEQIVSISQPEIRKKVKSFHVIVPGGLPEITTDPEAVQQVVLNLLINAAQACEKPDSEVTLRVGRLAVDERSLFIEVRDNGKGMDDAVKRRIFDPFFTTKGSVSGTGLGLYICYNLLQNLGGQIEVDSTPGQGSTFRVILTDQGNVGEPEA